MKIRQKKVAILSFHMDCRCGGRNASARVTWYAFSSALFTFLINCLCSALRRLGLPKEAGNTYTISASLSLLAITFQTRIRRMLTCRRKRVEGRGERTYKRRRFGHLMYVTNVSYRNSHSRCCYLIAPQSRHETLPDAYEVKRLLQVQVGRQCHVQPYQTKTGGLVLPHPRPAPST